MIVLLLDQPLSLAAASCRVQPDQSSALSCGERPMTRTALKTDMRIMSSKRRPRYFALPLPSRRDIRGNALGK
jgi:hypothetical protein